MIAARREARDSWGTAPKVSVKVVLVLVLLVVVVVV